MMYLILFQNVIILLIIIDNNMTTIIGRKLPDGTLQIAWDKRTTMSTWKYMDDQTKIIKLDNILLWKAGDSLSCKLITELYNKWKFIRELEIKKENNIEVWSKIILWIDTVLEAIDFYNYVKDNCNINRQDWEKALINFMILHKDFQILIEWSCSWQVTEMQWEIFSMWSWSDIVTTTYKISKEWKIKYNLELEDYYDIVSSMDTYTSKEFETLEMLPEILIHNN